MAGRSSRILYGFGTASSFDASIPACYGVHMYVLNEDRVVWRKVEGETVVLNLDTGYYYTLDELGGYIWELAVQRHEPAEIVDHVLREYEIDRATADADVRALLDEMSKEGFFGSQRV